MYKTLYNISRGRQMPLPLSLPSGDHADYSTLWVHKMQNFAVPLIVCILGTADRSRFYTGTQSSCSYTAVTSRIHFHVGGGGQS